MAYPKPLILFSLRRAITKANAVKINVRNVPVISSKIKSQIALLLTMPYNMKGTPKPIIKLIDSDVATPKYWPKNIELLLTGCARSNSVNSREL